MSLTCKIVSRSNLDIKSGAAGPRNTSGGRVAATSGSSGTADDQWSIRATGGASAPRVGPSSSSGPSGQVCG